MTSLPRILKLIALIWGAVLVVIGVGHIVLGMHSFPGSVDANATVDSQVRFYGGLCIGYGAAYVWVARQPGIETKVLRILTAITCLCVLGRLASMVDRGQPHWFFVLGTVAEAAMVGLTYWLSTMAADEREPQRAS